MKRIRFFLFISIVFATHFAFAKSWRATITPPNNGANANVYSEPGYDWKTCPDADDCRVVVLTRKGDVVEVLGKAIERNSKRYFSVEFDSLNGKKIGYIEESYLSFTGANPGCNDGPISQLVTLAGDALAKMFASSQKPLMIPSIKELFPQLNNQRVYSPRCKNIMDEYGNPGPWGIRLLQAMSDVDDSTDQPSCFYDRINVKSVCPKFSNLPQQEKMRFWLWIFTVKAMEESSCDPNARVPGANGLADGLFQMEYSRSWRANANRNEHFCKTKESIDTQDLTFQFECTASTLKDKYCDKDLPLVNPDGYWQNMNHISRRISQRIMTFPGCK